MACIISYLLLVSILGVIAIIGSKITGNPWPFMIYLVMIGFKCSGEVG